MLKEKWSTGLKKGLIISLSVLLMSSFVFYFGTHEVDAASWTGSSTHYNIQVSQASAGKDIVISWAPASTANSRYVDRVTLSLGANTNQNVYLYLYGSDSVVVSPASSSDPAQLNSVTTNSNYNLGSDVYFLNQYLSSINNNVNAISNNIASIEVWMDDFDTTLTSISSYLNQIANGGIYIKNYDVLLKQIPAIAFFVGNNGVLQSSNQFIGSSTLIFDYPIYKYISSTPVAYLTTDTTNDEYIFIVAVNSAYQIFSNTTYTAVSGWSNVETVETNYKRYSNQMQINYLIVRNLKDGETYTGARYYINFQAGAITHLNNEQYIPIYYGKYSECPEEFLDLVGLKPKEQQAGEVAADNMDNANDQFSNEISNIDTIQNDLEDDFQTNIQAIDTSFDPSVQFGSKFIESARWVRTQFENITSGTPFGSILFFALTLGLALMIIGRVI